jgi:hypothetical protein
VAWVPTAPERYERTSREDPPFVPAGRRTSGELRWLESQHSQPGWRRRARTNTAASRAGGSLFPHRAAEVRLGVALCVARRIRPSLSSPRRRRGCTGGARTLHPNLQSHPNLPGMPVWIRRRAGGRQGAPSRCVVAVRPRPRTCRPPAARARPAAPLGHPRCVWACTASVITTGLAAAPGADNSDNSNGARRP